MSRQVFSLVGEKTWPGSTVSGLGLHKLSLSYCIFLSKQKSVFGAALEKGGGFISSSCGCGNGSWSHFTLLQGRLFNKCDAKMTRALLMLIIKRKSLKANKCNKAPALV